MRTSLLLPVTLLTITTLPAPSVDVAQLYDTENCVSDAEVAQYEDGWSVLHVEAVFDVAGWVSWIGDEAFRRRYQHCPDGSDQRQVVAYWLDSGLSKGTWEITVD